MNLSDFDYHLPKELIASEPLAERTASRLLVLHQGQEKPQHAEFKDILSLLQPQDCLIFNDTKVMAARMHGQKPTGGRVELLIERCLSPVQALAHLRSSKAPKPGTAILDLDGQPLCEVTGRAGDLFELAFTEEQTVYQAMARVGEMPLPPYMERDAREIDTKRYQTVYAKDEKLGAVAAPTAGLHFDDALLAELEERGIATGFVTLHVGAGTFQPVRVENITEHVMHQEAVDVSAEVCALINKTKANGGRVIAVGTTSLRSLEGAAAAHGGKLAPYCGETGIFIYPGYQFQVIDCLITNFHLPQSTLLMLVSALGGYERVMAAYQEAIAERYRFFSYGDAMFIEGTPTRREGTPTRGQARHPAA